MNLVINRIFTLLILGLMAVLLPSLAYADLILPEDLVYIGAFRLPDGGAVPSTWAWGGSAMTYNPNGDPSGDGDGFPGSIYGVGHDWEHLVSEITIPTPIDSASNDVNDLNYAETLQDFADIRQDLDFEFGTEQEMLRTGLVYLPPQGSQTSAKLHFCVGDHMQEMAYGPNHAWCELDLSAPQSAGVWGINNLKSYVTADYIFAIPSSWATAHTPNYRLATGRYRDGGQGARGPSLIAYGPWTEGNPPAHNTQLNAANLLLYTDVTSPDSYTLDNYKHADEWVGGAWLTSAADSAVIFIGTKGTGDCWYGWYDGTVWPNDENEEGPGYRGWWCEGFVGQILFYNPDDFAAVAAGTMAAYEPQPYATMNIDSYLYNVSSDQQKYHVNAVAYDRQNGYLYILEPFADGDKPLIHVWQIDSGSAVEPPAAPTDLEVAEVTATSISMNWQDNADNETGFIIERSADGSEYEQLVFLLAEETSYTDRYLEPSSTFYYQVRAYNNGSKSTPSNQVNATTQDSADSEPPTVPQAVYAVATGANQIELWWHPAKDNVSVSGYRIYRDSRQIAEVTTTSFTDDSLTVNTTYTYQVSAFDSADNESGLSLTAFYITYDDNSIIVSNVSELNSAIDNANYSGGARSIFLQDGTYTSCDTLIL